MRPVRWLFPNAVWLVTNRCELEQFLLVPSQRVNQLIGASEFRLLYDFEFGVLSNKGRAVMVRSAASRPFVYGVQRAGRSTGKTHGMSDRK